jgi:type II secretory pathway pseudopilin PulG
MIVVVIIGILAAMAIPRFMRTTTKAKQSEAKQILKQIYTMQRAYRQYYDTYACNGQTMCGAWPNSFHVLGVEYMPSARYTYQITADAMTFTATATSDLDDDVAQDIWRIDQNGILVCISNDADGWADPEVRRKCESGDSEESPLFNVSAFVSFTTVCKFRFRLIFFTLSEKDTLPAWQSVLGPPAVHLR